MEYISSDDNPNDYHSISGSRLREAARKGEELPAGFMHPAAWNVLRDYFMKK